MIHLVKLLNVKEVAELFKVHVITVQRWLRSGKIKGTKVGGTWFVSEQEIKDLIERGV